MAFTRPLRTSAILGMAVLVIAGCSTQAPGDAEDPGGSSFEEIELVYAGQWPAGSPTAEVEQAFLDEVTARTDGKVTFQAYFGFSLLPIAELLPGVSSGVADVASIAAPNFPDAIPLSAWMSELGSIGSETMLQSTLAQRLATAEMFATTPQLREEMEGRNIMPLYMGAEIPADMMCNDAVETSDQAATKRVRVGGEPFRSEAEALNMVPVTLSSAEVYEGLERGTIDCSYTNATLASIGPGLVPVAPYYAGTRGSATLGSGYVINMDTWNELPDVVKQVFLDLTAEFAAANTRASIDAYAEFAETSEDEGVTFIDPTELDAVIAERQEELIATVAAHAPPSAGDAQALVDKYQELYEKWAGRVDGEILEVPAAPTGAADEQIRESLIQAPGAIDWDAYQAAFAEILAL